MAWATFTNENPKWLIHLGCVWIEGFKDGVEIHNGKSIRLYAL